MSECQVVISFLLDTSAPSVDQEAIAEHFRRLLVPVLIKPTWTVRELDVAVRVIGAAGETMEHEGVWPEGSLRTDDVQVVSDVHPTETVKPKDELL